MCTETCIARCPVDLTTVATSLGEDDVEFVKAAVYRRRRSSSIFEEGCNARHISFVVSDDMEDGFTPTGDQRMPSHGSSTPCAHRHDRTSSNRVT
jgi:hypothetical protein